MANPEVNGYQEGRWAKEMFTFMVDDLRDDLETVDWAEDALTEYNGLPKVNNKERGKVEVLLGRSADLLLRNPQKISTAAFVWERLDPFYKRIKEKSKALIGEKWEDITAGQLAQLVRTYADTDNLPGQDFAKEMLTGYFSGPKTRSKRIRAYYTFVSSLLDLVGDDRALEEGVKIAHHDTDILPKNPHLMEQVLFLSLPYDIFILSDSPEIQKDLFSLPTDKDKERDFQELIIIRHTLVRLVSMGSEDSKESPRKEEDFIQNNPELTARWKKAQAQAVDRIGEGGLKQLNGTLYLFFGSDSDILSAKENTGNAWLNSLLDDISDPLNQKFKKVFSENSSNSGARVELGSV